MTTPFLMKPVLKDRPIIMTYYLQISKTKNSSSTASVILSSNEKSVMKHVAYGQEITWKKMKRIYRLSQIPLKALSGLSMFLLASLYSSMSRELLELFY
jgi:hypothetical protein